MNPINTSLGFLLFLVFAVAARAGEVSVAVAANFAAPMKLIASNFSHATGHKALLSFGSTGKLYAQIRNGAPFEVLLAADSGTPQRLIEEGLAVGGTQFTYALGQLALWSAQPQLVDEHAKVLGSARFARLALADPKLAPYGAAALETLASLGLADILKPRFVTAESVGQAYQFVASGNAELGFVALSQVVRDGKLLAGSVWRVPNGMHQPLRQDLVVLKAGEHRLAARSFAAYLRSDEAREVIRAFGYEEDN